MKIKNYLISSRFERKLREKEKKKKQKISIFGILFAIVVGILVILIKKRIIYSIASFFIVLILFFLIGFFVEVLKKSGRVKKMELVFPDFLQLVASNLRAGITIDKAILLAVRKEFAPLDEEILRAGKEITTGKGMSVSLENMARRIGSEKIMKTIMLINSGISSGGNLSVLLEQTATNMREREFIKKKASSNVMMYAIFIFIAVSIGAPALFSLSTILVQTMSGMMSSNPAMANSSVGSAVPFSFSSINISVNFLVWFSIVFIIVIDVLASLIIGLVNKGEEKEGLKYLIPILVMSLSIFLLIRYFLSGFISNLF